MLIKLKINNCYKYKCNPVCVLTGCPCFPVIPSGPFENRVIQSN